MMKLTRKAVALAGAAAMMASCNHMKQIKHMPYPETQRTDVVDDYFLKVKSSLIRMIADKPEDGEYALDLLMIAKYFERIGDHAVNIAEWVVFSVTGVHKNEEG